MEVWILFYWFANYADSAVETQEFGSESSCIAAGQRLQKERTGWTYLCTPK